MGVGGQRSWKSLWFSVKRSWVVIPQEDNKYVIYFFYIFLNLVITPIVEAKSELEKVECSPRT